MPVQRQGESIAAGISTDAGRFNEVNEDAEEALRRAQAWFVGQKEAFQAAMNGATLETSLDILIRTAIEQAGSDRRCAFYRVGADGTGLHHVVGMGDAYARQVDGFRIGPDSLACGLAAWTGRPVVTPDVDEDPRWTPWLGLAREFNFRGCWSFPVETSTGRIVGTFAMYFRTPRIPTASDRDLIASLTHSAAIIVSHDEEMQTRKKHESELNQNEAHLQEALAAGSVTAYEWDATTDVVRRSANVSQILGIDPPHALGGQAFMSRVHPDDRVRLTTLLSGLNRDNPTYSTTYRFLRPDGREIWFQDTSRADFDDAGRLVRIKGLGVDITERKRAEEHQKMLAAELDHRVKNALARVAMVAESTSHGTKSIDEFMRALKGRIQSMATAHALLSKSSWQSIGLEALVRSQLGPYTTDENTTIEGAAVELTTASTQAVAMVLHELVTNAAKYGALSTPTGHVSVTWECSGNGSAASTLGLIWRERGGPPVATSVQSSYGTDLICNLIPHELGGQVDLAFEPDGVNCRIEIPVALQ